MISDKTLELNISLVLEVRGDSVECIGIQVIKPGGGLAGNGIDPHRAMTRTGKGNQWDERGSSLVRFSCACFRERADSRRGTTRREEGRADRYHGRLPEHLDLSSQLGIFRRSECSSHP